MIIKVKNEPAIFDKKIAGSLFGVPERIRTSDLPLRRRSLYPTELRKHRNQKHIDILQHKNFRVNI